MAVRFYDDALLNKLKNWIPGTSATITGVNESKRLFEVTLDKSGDKPIQLPMIVLSRPGGYRIVNKNQRPLAHAGLVATGNQKMSATVNAIPIDITYQLDIYTRYLEEADEYARNFIFNLINYPRLTINIPYEDIPNLQHDANIRISSEVEDNSDIPERLISGQFSRLTIGINIDDAYLFDVRVKDNLKIAEVSTIADFDKAESSSID